MGSLTVAEIFKHVATADDTSILKRTMLQIIECSLKGLTSMVLEYPDSPADDLGMTFLLYKLEVLGFVVDATYSEATISWE